MYSFELNLDSMLYWMLQSRHLLELSNSLSFLCWTLEFCICLCCRFSDDGMQTRAHLEAQLASSLALKSPNEYRQCLLSYIRFLAR